MSIICSKVQTPDCGALWSHPISKAVKVPVCQTSLASIAQGWAEVSSESGGGRSAATCVPKYVFSQIITLQCRAQCRAFTILMKPVYCWPNHVGKCVSAVVSHMATCTLIDEAEQDIDHHRWPFTNVCQAAVIDVFITTDWLVYLITTDETDAFWKHA